MAKPDEEVLQDPQHAQAALQQQQMLQQQQQAAGEQAAAQAEREANEDRVIAHLFEGGQAEGYRKPRHRLLRGRRFVMLQYAKPGDTKAVGGRLYRLNENIAGNGLYREGRPSECTRDRRGVRPRDEPRGDSPEGI